MKLAEFFATIGPFLEGQLTHDQAKRALYPQNQQNVNPDAERLDIYGRFCAIHRSEALQFTFAYCREVVVRVLGESGWERLVARYFQAHPMFHVELNENGALLPELLCEWASEAGLPSWIGELADFEWWEWRTSSALDSEEDARPEEGPLRLASTVELRPYAHDLIAWCDGDRKGDPIQRPIIVLFWRDLDLDGRRERCSETELAALKMASEGLSIEALVAAGIDRAALEEALADLRDAGVILGEPAPR